MTAPTTRATDTGPTPAPAGPRPRDRLGQPGRPASSYSPGGRPCAAAGRRAGGRLRYAGAAALVGLVAMSAACSAAWAPSLGSPSRSARPRPTPGRRRAARPDPDGAHQPGRGRRHRHQRASCVGGLEPPAARTAYSDGIAAAARTLADAAGSDARDAVALRQGQRRIAGYTGLIESARANNRQGFPIGAAYLRAATTLLRTDALPVLDALVSAEQQRVDDAYDDQRAGRPCWPWRIVLALVVLIGCPVWLAIRTRRLLNLPLAVADRGASSWSAASPSAVMTRPRRQANDVRDGAYPAPWRSPRPASTRFDAKSEESLTLITRGSGQAYEERFKTRRQATGDPRRRLPRRAAPRAGDQRRPSDLLAVHTKIREPDDGGDWDEAVALATGTDRPTPTRSSPLRRALGRRPRPPRPAQLSTISATPDAAGVRALARCCSPAAAGRRGRLAGRRHPAAGVPSEQPLHRRRRPSGRRRRPLALASSRLVAGCTESDCPAPAADADHGHRPRPADRHRPADCGNPVASSPRPAPLPAPGQHARPARSMAGDQRARAARSLGVSADTLLFGSATRSPAASRASTSTCCKQVATAIFGDAERPDRVPGRHLRPAHPGPPAGQVDIVADVMTINCARWNQISFSSEYFHAGQKVLVRTDSTPRASRI